MATRTNYFLIINSIQCFILYLKLIKSYPTLNKVINTNCFLKRLNFNFKST